MNNKLFPIIALLLITIGGCSSQQLHAGTWPNIRDGVVHIRVPGESPNSQRKIQISWQDAWISEAQTDHLYLLNPDGSLNRKLRLIKNNTPGTADLELPEPGDYQLHVTGASFRNISVHANKSLATQFEPVKVHKSISVPTKGRVYFSNPEGKAFKFAAKYHGGPTTFYITPIDNQKAKPLRLRLDKQEHHWEFDSLLVPAGKKNQLWQVTWDGSGKVAFWLDGIANLFAISQAHLFKPDWQAGTAHITVGNGISGTVPAIGAALPFTNPPQSSYELLDKWQLNAANHYTFSDALTDKPHHDISFLKLYENRFGIKNSSIILAETGRQPLIRNVDRTAKFLNRYLKERHQNGLLNNAYLAFADEPNLNYPDYETFARHFAKLASGIKKSSDPAVNATLIAAPQSSRFVNGPTRSGAEQRRGIDWAEQLIKSHGQWLDAISWHEWMVRDLIDTSRYQEAVIAAQQLVAQHQDILKKDIKLIIGQTNISSGKSLSLYEQETHFAALWWTSVVIQSSQSGALDQLVWFKAADDPNYPKGLATVTPHGYQEKPVSKAMTFINRHMGRWVLQSNSSHPEVDLLATLSEDKAILSLLGVNKSPRRQQLTIQLPESVADPELILFNEQAPAALTTNAKGREINVSLEGETIFVIKVQRLSKPKG